MKPLKDMVHLVSGLVSALITFHAPVVGAVMTLLFIIYQLDESWHIRDESWIDILEYSVGYYVAAIVYWMKTYILV